MACQPGTWPDGEVEGRPPSAPRAPAASRGRRAAGRPTRSCASAAPSRASPWRQRAVDLLLPELLGAVAQGREVGDQADVPEEQRDRARRSRPRRRPRSAGCGSSARSPSCSGRAAASRPRATGGRCGRAGRSAAQATAKSVIASAKRLIEVRHSCRSSSRIAEISVPAWPMPIHQTKLMMSKPQPTGLLLPQMPMPVKTSLVSGAEQHQWRRRRRSPSRRRTRAACLPKTTALILSVTDAGEWPGRDDRRTSTAARTPDGGIRRRSCRRAPGWGCWTMREVGGARPGAELARAARSCAGPSWRRDLRRRVVEVAEDDRLRSGRPAGRRCTISPSRTCRPSRSAAMRARLMRCTQ